MIRINLFEYLSPKVVKVSLDLNIRIDVEPESCGTVYVVDGGAYGPSHMASMAGWHKRVQKFDTDGNFLGKWSTWDCRGLGPGDCRDGRPKHPNDRLADQGIAIDSKGFVYVQNERRNLIRKYDSNGKFIDDWGIRDCSGHSQSGRACNTPDIAINNRDILHVTDEGRRQIDRYDSSGSPVAGDPPRKVAVGGGDTYSTFAKASDVGNAAYGIAIDSKDNVYIASRSLPGIKKFNSTGKLVHQWGGRPGSGSKDGKFYMPTGVAIGKDGNVYVTDMAPPDHPVQVFTPNGKFLLSFGVYITGKGKLNSARFIAVDDCGNVFVTQSDDSAGKYRSKWNPKSPYGNWVLKFSSAGKLLGFWGGKGSADGQFVDPSGIAIGKGKAMPWPDYRHHKDIVWKKRLFMRPGFSTVNFPSQ